MLPKLKVLFLCTGNSLFDDPPRLAADASSEEESLEHYRCVRDEIRTFIENLPRKLAVSQGLDDGSNLDS